MDRKFLEDLGLEKDIVDKVLNQNGSELKKEKDKFEAKEAELNNAAAEIAAAKEQLATANKTIEGFGDVEAIKGQVTEYKTKYEKSETEYQAKFEAAKGEYETKLADMALDSALKDKLAGYKFSSDYAKQGVLNEIKSKGLKLDGDKIIGFDDVFGAIKEAQPAAFATDEPAATVVVDLGKQQGCGAGNQQPKNLQEALHDKYERK